MALQGSIRQVNPDGTRDGYVLDTWELVQQA